MQEKLRRAVHELVAGIRARRRTLLLSNTNAIHFDMIRENYPIGCKVTLRRAQMFEFLDRLITIAIPRIRDFRGLNPRAFDGRGNYSLGVREQIIFPEIDYDKVDAIHGMDITFVTSAKTDEEGRSLLKLMGMPFRA